MKTRTFLAPMTPDGKPGEVIEMQVNDGAPQYLEPLAENDDLGKLRQDVHTAAAKLQHAKARGVGVPEAQKAHEAAKSAAGKAHFEMQKQRVQERTGVDYGTVDPFSRQSDSRQFMEPVPYFTRNDNDPNDTTGRTFDDEADDDLEAQILAAVTALEAGIAAGASPAEMLKLAEVVKLLRDQLPNPSAPPGATTAAPPRRVSMPEDWPGTRPAGQSAAIPGSNPNPTPTGKKKETAAARKAGWDKHLADLDKRLAARALAAVYPSGKGASSPTAPVIHAQNTCCEGAYKCARCKAKAAA